MKTLYTSLAFAFAIVSVPALAAPPETTVANAAAFLPYSKGQPSCRHMLTAMQTAADASDFDKNADADEIRAALNATTAAMADVIGAAALCVHALRAAGVPYEATVFPHREIGLFCYHLRDYGRSPTSTPPPPACHS